MKAIGNIFGFDKQVVKTLQAIEIETGQPLSVKTTPTRTRVAAEELELTYIHNPTVFNGINKIVQTIMSAPHSIACEDKKVLDYFKTLIGNIGNSGSDITWEELLERIFKFQCIYGWSWVENVFNKKANRIVDWELVDPKKMNYAKNSLQKIALDNFGVPLGYVEKLPYTENIPKEIQARLKKQEIPKGVVLSNNEIFIPLKNIALTKLFTVGDEFYPIGLIEPLYKTSLWKMNIEEALANAIYRHGFPTMVAKIGDLQHEPTPTQIQNVLNKMKEASFKQEMAIPYYYSIELLEPKKAEKLREHLEYFKEQEVAGMGIPKPYATGGGEATNRATLKSQNDLFQLTLKTIVNTTCRSIERNMFRIAAELEEFKTYPKLMWGEIGVNAIETEINQIIELVKTNIITVEEARAKLKELE